MSYVLMPIPKQQFVGSNGRPLSGGKLYTYSAGTNTAKATYTDSTGSTPNANPIILDSSGRASVWLNGFYKIVLYDANDVLQYSVDNVSGEQAEAASVYAYASDYDNLNDAIDTIGSTNTHLIVSDNQTLTANLIVPSNIHLEILKTGQIASGGYTLTINGSFSSGMHQVFSGFSSGSVAFGVGTIDWVFSEWWGATSKSTKAASIDCTTAIRSAIATGKNVKLLDGYYGFTATSAAAFYPRFDGQKFVGSGRRIADANGGTYLYKMSGTYSGIYMGAFGGMELSDFTIDGNNLAGNLVTLAGTYYSSVHGVNFKGQGGTDFALYLDDWNVCDFADLSFESSCYAGIKFNRTASAGYSTFRDIIIGAMTGDAIYIGNLCTNISFDTATIEDTITFQGTAEAISFNNLGIETAVNTGPLVTMNGASLRNISFTNVRLYRSAATTHAEFAITDAKNIVIDNIYIQDLFSLAAKDIITIDGGYGINVRNVQVYTTNALDFIECSGDVSYQVLLENCNYTSGAAATCKWKTSNLTVINSNFNHAWVDGTGSNNYFQNVTGTITTANIGSLNTFMNCGYAPSFETFVNGDTTPSVKVSPSYVTANTNPTTITMFDDGYDGQTVWIIFGDTNTTIDFTGTNLKGNNGSDFTGAVGDSIYAISDGTNWYCTVNQG